MFYPLLDKFIRVYSVLNQIFQKLNFSFYTPQNSDTYAYLRRSQNTKHTRIWAFQNKIKNSWKYELPILKNKKVTAIEKKIFFSESETTGRGGFKQSLDPKKALKKSENLQKGLNKR